MALAGKKDGRGYRVYTLMGDGELAEGSVWEACMLASHYKLDNLVAIVDRNRLQITAGTEAVNSLEPLRAKFEASSTRSTASGRSSASEVNARNATASSSDKAVRL